MTTNHENFDQNKPSKCEMFNKLTIGDKVIETNLDEDEAESVNIAVTLVLSQNQYSNSTYTTI